MTALRISRRTVLAMAQAAALASLTGTRGSSQGAMPSRPIPSTGELLPVIGLGSSKVVEQIADNGPEPLEAVLRTLVEHGGRVVDTWPRNPDNDAAFGRVTSQPGLREALFVTSKIDRTGRQAGIDQFEQTLDLYRRESVDLAQVFSLTDLDTHWPSLRALKAAGKARYIGVTVAQYELYDRLERFLRTETPDFVQINYSITERRAEDRLLPMIRDKGIAALINRPFMNGAYFDRLEDTPLPDWAQEFECRTWAQFSLQYILANEAVTCVLTETSDPAHMADNALTATAPLPGRRARRRMRAFIDVV
jgi:diketogulonate reductase-like aldo/keto reductase